MLEARLREKGKTVLCLDVGQALREYAADTASPPKEHLSNIMKTGKLVPSAFPIAVVLNGIMEQQTQHDCLVFDGLGRRRIEAEIFIDLIEFFPKTKVHVILLDISENEAMQRLRKRGRYDDTEDAIKTRFALFNDMETGTTAALNFLRNRSDVAFHTIDGSGTTEEIFQQIVSELDV